MPKNHLEELFQSVQKTYFNKNVKRIDVAYYPFRSLKHTIEWTPWRIRIRINQHFMNAPEKVMEDLAIILLAKVYKVKNTKEARKRYNDFVEILRQSLPPKKFNRLDVYKAKGKVYDLSKIFHQLNQLYFSNGIKPPVIGWSRKKSYRRLGFYDQERNLLVVSRNFDQKNVPEDIIRYLVYHEMLHMQYPSIQKNGRRIVHSRQFRETEKQFPQYEEIQDWLKLNLRKL
jgi:predicted metal-dependent hydrolase